MFLNIFCVLALFRLHFFIFRFCLCVLWFTSLSLPLKCFLQNILCSAFLGYIFYFWFLFVCTLVYLHLVFFEKICVFVFKVICFIFGFCLCVLWFASLFFPLFFIEYFVFLFFKVIFFWYLVFVCVCFWFASLSFPLILFTKYFWLFEIYLFFLDTLLCHPHVWPMLCCCKFWNIAFFHRIGTS